jgi:hypothetical protein
MKKLLLISFAILALLPARAQNCPGISVVPFTDEVSAGDTMMFTVFTKILEYNVTYNWTISAGTIMSGQGTARILVDTKEIGGEFVTATVELIGLPAKCSTTASASAEVIPAAQLVVTGTFTQGQELKNAVQKFIAATDFKDSANTGTCFIYLYKTPNTTESALEIFKKAIGDAFEFNKIYPYQYKIADGGEKKLATYEFYLMGPGAKDPKPSE